MEELEKKILDAMNKRFFSHSGLTKLAKVVSEALQEDYNSVLSALVSLEKSGDIYEFTKHKYITAESAGIVRGKIVFNSPNFGFVLSPEGDVYIAKRNTLGAFDGDVVLAKITHEEKGGKRREGKVLKILSRDNNGIVGTFVLVKSYGYVKPERKNFDIFIPAGSTLGAHDGDKVVCDIVEYKSGNPVGKVTEVIGSLSERGNDIKWILRQHKIVGDFPEQVLKIARSFSQTIDKTKISNRRDLRDSMLFTIDGADAKDLDDAVSLKKNSDGTYLLGVHIADVGEYVTFESPIDEEAFRRATSIYFINDVIPMLPKELSNGICSLNENEERLALSVEMKIDATGDVISSEVFESVIRSKHRLNYDEVLELLDGNTAVAERLSDIKQTLFDMLELSNILEARRKKCGSLDFDLPEGKVIVDGNGKPVDVLKRVATKSTKLIETFMVVANETVAKKFFDAKIPFVYRVHETPDADKMATFYNFLGTLGIQAPESKKDVTPKDLQGILDKVDDKDFAEVVNMMMLRSLKKAKYFDKCLGHFGLALQFYCHFTSPIRRYPDLCIHRIIKDYLRKNYSLIKSPKMADFVERASAQSSNQEKLSEDVERAIEDYKKCEYMSQFIGQTFSGIISSVSSRGFYVELENTCEGLVSVSSLKDDFYDFDERKLMLVSKHNYYKIGEKVEVKVLSCNLPERKTEFGLVKKIR